MKIKIIKNIPNALTISRIISSILGAGVFVAGNIPLATGFYVYGAISDFFDGLAARKLNAFSELGRKLDALSDKLYAGSLLIPSILCGNLLMIIPLGLELKISQINLKSQKLGFKTATQRIGKFKTALLFPTMITGLLATISVEFYPLLWLLLPISTILQSKSIVSYENLLKHNISKQKVVKESLDDDCQEKNTKEIICDTQKRTVVRNKFYNKSVSMADELAFYITTPYFSYEQLDNEIETKNKPYAKIKRRMK